MVKLLKFPACKLMRALPHATYVVRMRLKQLHAQGGAHLHTYQGMVPKILTPVSTGRICLLPALNGRSGPPNQVSTGKEPHKRKCRTDESSHQRGISYVVLAACQAAERIVFRKSATLPFSDTACSCSAAATASAASAPASVSPATALTSTISRVTAAVPVAACSTLRAISPVAAPCCSTADAIALAISAISRTVASNWEIAVTVSPVALWMVAI